MKKGLLIIGVIFTLFTGCNNNKFQPANNNYNSYSKKAYVGDFSQVCNGGKVDGTAGYDKAVDTTSRVSIFFQPNPEQPFRDPYLSDFPKDWQMNSYFPEETQLAACVTIKESKENKRCPYNIGTLIKNNAKYNFKIYEAKTGMVVAEKDFDLKPDKECPYVEFFDSGEKEKTEMPDYKQQLINFLKPLVKH